MIIYNKCPGCEGETYNVYAVIVAANDLHTCGMMAITTGNHQAQYVMPLIYLSGNMSSSHFLLFVTTGVTDCGVMPTLTLTGRHCSTTNLAKPKPVAWWLQRQHIHIVQYIGTYMVCVAKWLEDI